MRTIKDIEREFKAARDETHDWIHGIWDQRGGDTSFTPDEQKKADGYMEQIEKLRKELDQARGAKRQMDALRELGAEAGQKDSQNGAKHGSWAAAFISEMGQRGITGSKAFLTPSGSVALPMASDVVPAVGEQLTSLLQAIPGEVIQSDGFNYLREVTRTHAAAAVAVSAEKPESTYELEAIGGVCQMIAHVSKPIPRQYFMSAPNLERYLDAVMRLGLQTAIEREVLAGGGSSPHLEGILDVSGRGAQLFSMDILATCRKARTNLELLNVPIGDMVYVMNPTDWESIELTEAVDSGLYKLNGGSSGLPVNLAARKLWGVSVALSIGIAQGTGVLFDRTAVRLYSQGGAQLTWSEAVVDSETNLSDFVTNQVRLRCEQPVGLAIYNPSHIVEIELEAGS